jgi:lipopolysaccharide export system protein LptA
LAIPLVAAPVHFAGGRFEIDQKRDIVTLTGNAKVITGSNTLTAKKITVYQRQDLMLAEGQVLLVNSGRKSQLTGGRLTYDTAREYAVVTENPEIWQPVDRVRVKATVLTGLMKEDRGTALTNVRITREGSNALQATSEWGAYFQDLSTLKLYGQVVIDTTNTHTTCAHAVVVHGKQTLWAETNVRAITWDETNRLATNTLLAHRVIYAYPETKREFFAYTNVSLLDFKTGGLLSGGFLKHLPDEGYTWVTEKPKYVMKGEGDLEADLFERFERKQLLYARGNVTIHNEGQTALAGLALHRMNEEKTTLYINPRVVDQNGSVIFAERISMTRGDNRFLMEGRVQGRFLE